MISDQKRDILLNVFYGDPPITSIRGIYDKVKQNGITLKEIKEFTKNQEVNQMYRKIQRVKHYFPITAQRINQIWQIDLLDMSDIATVNNNIKYFFVAIDVFSRFASVVPMKNKVSKTIIDAMKESFNVMSGKPEILNCDNGSEFINKDFKKFVKDNNIEVRYVQVGDHHKLGIVDRFNRTLRDKINKLLTIKNTTRYIDSFVSIVNNYNDTYHSGINKVPRDVKDEDASIRVLNNKKYVKALKEESKFNVGDKVRYIKNKVMFEKGSLPKWSKEIHEVIDNTKHTYTLDNNKTYKYYQLMKIDHVEVHGQSPHTLPKRSLGEVPDLQNAITPTREKIRKDNKVKRTLRREEMLSENIIEGKRQTKRSTTLKDYI